MLARLVSLSKNGMQEGFDIFEFFFRRQSRVNQVSGVGSLCPSASSAS